MIFFLHSAEAFLHVQVFIVRKLFCWYVNFIFKGAVQGHTLPSVWQKQCATGVSAGSYTQTSYLLPLESWLPLTCCVTLNKLFNFASFSSSLQCDVILPGLLQGLSELKSLKHLKWYLSHSQCSMSVTAIDTITAVGAGGSDGILFSVM